MGKLEKIAERTKFHSEGILKEELRPFKESMNRRFKRDVDNLDEYYESLRREMEKSLERPGLLPDQIEDRKDKIALLPGELARKRDDLYKKYSIKIRIAPCAAMFITTPAVKILYRVAVGKKQTTLPLIYNPVTRLIDPRVCQGCGRGITNIYFCDHLHILCSRCIDRCPLC